jgi:hypothetical protein
MKINANVNKIRIFESYEKKIANRDHVGTKIVRINNAVDMNKA